MEGNMARSSRNSGTVQPFIKFVGLALVAAALVVGYKFVLKPYLIENQSGRPAQLVPPSDAIVGQAPIANGAMPAPVANSGHTGARPPSVESLGRQLREGQEVRLVTIPWQATRGLQYANGGPRTVEGSLMAQQGVTNLTITRQDDMGVHANGIIDCANEMHSTGRDDCSNGYHFTSMMGDGGAYYIESLNSRLERLGEEYQVEIVGSAGYSRGEDKFMGPPEVAENCLLGRGMLVAAYVLDGDWNIAMEWASQCGILNNPDPTTYNPNALNWVEASDFMVAVQMYNGGHCENRTWVDDTGRPLRPQPADTRVCVNGVGTWTPGDVATLTQEGGRGGLVSIASTEQYTRQMPNAIIGIRRWNRAHPELVAGMLAAAMQGADVLKSNPAEFRRSGDIAAVVFDQHNGEWWNRYFTATTVRDTGTGLDVRLGGSYVNNWLDNQDLFGLDGSRNDFQVTYERFGDLAVTQYPDEIDSYYPWEEVHDLRYLRMAAERLDMEEVQPIPQVNFAAVSPTARVVAQRPYSITFRTGSASFDANAEAELRTLLNSATIGSSMRIVVQGHTDNVGNFDRNMQLSEERAFAVKTWLEQQDRSLFPEGRIVVQSYGSTQPVAPNSTEEGRAQNRRVVIQFVDSGSGV
jgi:outer membrane protein OmpA-like peptidoglycan-associated protein